MMQKTRSGGLTEEELREWREYARGRDLSPSIEGQRIYRRQRPDDKAGYIVKIKSGGEDQLNIQVLSRRIRRGK